MQNKITVFTPTYNRGYCLGNLYEKLLKQKYENFEWIIVDDGSTDSTRQIIKKWIEENKINIRYIYQQNSGKQMAYNEGVKNATGDLFICIDSDDYYIEDSFSYINENWNSIKNDSTFAGMGFLSAYDNGEIIGSKFPKDILDSNHLEIYTKHKVIGDKGLVFRTSVLKQYPFQILEGEKFIMEALVYNRISNKYKSRYFNKVVEIKEYRSDGLTKSFDKLLLDNPMGVILYYNEYMVSKVRFRSKVGVAFQYIKLCRHINKNTLEIIKNSYNKIVVLLAYTLGKTICKSKLK